MGEKVTVVVTLQIWVVILIVINLLFTVLVEVFPFKLKWNTVINLLFTVFECVFLQHATLNGGYNRRA